MEVTLIAGYDYLIELMCWVPGQAVQLGAASPVAAVVLEAPLTSTIEVARSAYFLAAARLADYGYIQKTNIPSHPCPARRAGPWAGGSIAQLTSQSGLNSFPSTHDDLFEQSAWERTQAFVYSLGGAK